MEVIITGGSSTRKLYAESIARFVADKLMPRLAPKLRVNISIVKNLAKNQNVYGDCIWEDDEYRPKEFCIRVDGGLRLRSFIQTIAHEMVHVKQYARGELYQGSRIAKHRWQGKWLDKNPDYWDQPWEIEAHGRECGLFIRWAEQEGHANKAWAIDKELG